MLRLTPARRIGTISTVLSNFVIVTANTVSVHDPFSVLFLAGVIFRVFSLPLTIYGDRCLARAACALPELVEAHQHYKEIVDHPRAILWEKKVAAQKLKNDRDRIFRSYHTDNVRMIVPHAAALGATLYSLCIPTQQLSDFLTITSTVSSPLILHVAGLAVDPTLVIAASLTLFSTRQHLQRRAGFNDGLDEWIRQVNRNAAAAWCVFALSALILQPMNFFPLYLAPVWLGIASLSACKSVLVNHTAPMRALFGIPDYPPAHGTYGNLSTAEAHEYRLVLTGVDAEERRDMWQTQKKALDYECNVRLQRILRTIGLFDRVEEAEHEAEKLQRKLDVARAMRKRREQQQEEQQQDEGTSHAGQQDGEAPVFPEDIVGPSAQSVADAHFDAMRVEENQRRQRRRGEVDAQQS